MQSPAPLSTSTNSDGEPAITDLSFNQLGHTKMSPSHTASLSVKMPSPTHKASMKTVGLPTIATKEQPHEFCIEQAINPDRDASRALLTKLVCTQGPACWSVEQICEFIRKGMTIARLNFSHGDHESHAANVGRLNEAMKITGKKIGILLDTKGPEIRTGFFKPECGGKIALKAGDDLKMYVDYETKGDSTGFACSYPQLITAVKAGSTILCADGSLVLKVKETAKPSDAFVLCQVMNDAEIGERKNMNLPGIKVELPVVGPQEKKDFLEFGIPQGVHYVAASFVQCAQDVHEIRKVLGEAGKDILIISKIENVEGILNFDEILEASDGIMVARGDMGMEIPPQKVFVAQKMMISRCNLVGKPVITATQMLESMCGNPRPTRAEASDVANAVIDGTDMVMLSGESAGGKFPMESVTALGDICVEAEATTNTSVNFQNSLSAFIPTNNTESLALSVCAGILKRNVAAIVTVTESGDTARAISRLRPNVPVIAITNKDSTIRQLQCVRGIFCYETETLPSSADQVKKIVDACFEDLTMTPSNNGTYAVVYGSNTGAGNTNAMAFI